jgi:hypothetical protein
LHGHAEQRQETYAGGNAEIGAGDQKVAGNCIEAHKKKDAALKK